MSSLLNTNLSFYTVPLAWVLSIIPHAYAIAVHDGVSSKKFDITQPRSLTASLDSNQTVDKATKDKIVRAEGAQQNGFENVGLFAAAVVAGNVAHVEPTLLNALAYGYLASRVVYNVIYINNTSWAMGQTRTAVFLSGIGCCFALFITAGNKLRQ